MIENMVYMIVHL